MDLVRQQEEQHLAEVVEKINDAKTILKELIEEVGADNLAKLKDLRSDPETGTNFEMFLAQLHEKNLRFDVKGKFQRLEEFDYLLNQPYFARIDLDTEDKGIPANLYIGKFGYNEDEPIVTDWRASIASIYYRYRFPQKNVEYKTIEGTKKADLKLKRTYDIDEGKLVKYYNNDIQLDENEIVVDKINQRTGGILEDIIETIQTDQMDIIEADPRQICIVQGCVGSGKSTVAIHKLAHIFFHFANYIHPERSILIVKNQILIGYLATLFPKLGIFDINFKTLRDLIVNTIFREELQINVDLDQQTDTTSYTIEKIEKINALIDAVHKSYEDKIKSIFYDPDAESFGGSKYSKDYTPYENLNDIFEDLTEEVESMQEFIKENAQNARSLIYKSNISKLRSILRKVTDLKHALKKETLPNVLEQLEINSNKKLGYLDTLTYLYIFRKLIGFKKTTVYEYCIIDEGQDFSLIELAVLNGFVLRGRFGIFGDLNQMVSDNGVTDWADIAKVIPEAKRANIFKLETNFRSTKQIIDLANKIMRNHTDLYLPKSINRQGPEPILTNFKSKQELVTKFLEDINEDIKNLDKSIGIICLDNEYKEYVYAEISKSPKLKNIVIKLEQNKQIPYVPKGVYIMSMEDCKGLEFSRVYILGLDITKSKSLQDARKAFVAVTRAMSELVIYNTNE